MWLVVHIQSHIDLKFFFSRWRTLSIALELRSPFIDSDKKGRNQR